MRQLECLAEPPSDEELLELLILGLYWLDVEREAGGLRAGTERGLGALSIFGTYHTLHLIDKGLQYGLRNSPSLISLAMRTGTTIRHKGSLTATRLQDVFDDSQKPFVIMIRGAQGLNYSRLFGPKGYTWVITAVGHGQAKQLESKYEKVVQRSMFLAGWEQHRRRNGAFFASLKDPAD